MAFSAFRLFVHDPDRNAGVAARAFTESFPQTKTALRHLADGVYVSDRRSGAAVDLFRSVESFIFAGRGGVRTRRGMCNFLARLS